MTMTINGSGTITGLSAGGLPDATIQQADLATNVAGTGPAFSAYSSSAQSISTGTWTKVQCNTEEFDTNSNYDKDTNYRFQPTVAGYYQVNGSFNPQVASSLIICSIYKNGSRFKDFAALPSSSGGGGVVGSALIYLNGSNDYIEFYGYQASAGSGSLTTNVYGTYFQALMVRGA